MFRLFRVARGHKYYKEIAKLLGSEVHLANEEISLLQGECVLYDEKHSNPKTILIEEARNNAKQLGLDLILLKEDIMPILQIKPYIYTIYRDFYRKTGGKKGLGIKSIPISNRIMLHDLNTKKYIVNQLLKKGHNRFNLIGANDSQQNKDLMQQFCSLMEWHGNYHFSTATRGKGKVTMDYWICHVDCGDVKLPINYKALDKKYTHMMRVGGEIKWKSEQEQEQDIDEQIKQEDLYDGKTSTERFKQMLQRGQASQKAENEKGVNKPERQEQTQQQIMARAKDIMRRMNVQSDEDMLDEIESLEAKDKQMTAIEFKRLTKLRLEWKTRRRLLQ